MTATENAGGHGGRFPGVPGKTCGAGWYRAFRSELLAAQHPPDPATSSLASPWGRRGDRMRGASGKIPIFVFFLSFYY